jgi:hypothetical protein
MEKAGQQVTGDSGHSFNSRNSPVNNRDLALRRQLVNPVDAERLSILAFSSALTFSQTRTNNFPMPCLDRLEQTSFARSWV